MSNHWKRSCKKLHILINNEHIYVNAELFCKIRKNKSKNAEFSLRLSKNVSQLNEILSAFKLNANVHSCVQTNALSIDADIFEIAANHTYDSKKKISTLLNRNLESKKEKKNSFKVDTKNLLRIEERKSNEKKSFRRQNSLEQKIMFLKQSTTTMKRWKILKSNSRSFTSFFCFRNLNFMRNSIIQSKILKKERLQKAN